MTGSPFGPMLVIANPWAGRGRDQALAPLRRALGERGLDHAVAVTEGAGHATVLAREAVTSGGVRYVVAVGGDGTVNEVVNGLVDAATGGPRAAGVVLGIVPGGSGCDLSRTFGLDRRPEILARHLATATVQPIDLGRVRLTGLDGQPSTRLFANVAEAGYGGVVVERAARLPRSLGQLRYLVGILAALRRFEEVDTEVTVDHTSVREPLANVVVANGQFFGGGMKVAPRALPDDGRFNVQLWRGTVADVIRKTPRLRVGEHLPDPDVREYQSTSVRIDGAPLVLEADGEVLGRTPATIDLLPRVLRLSI